MSDEITPAMTITLASDPSIKNPLERVYTASLQKDTWLMRRNTYSYSNKQDKKQIRAIKKKKRG